MAIFVLSLGFQSRFFHGSSPETLQGKNVLEDPRRNPRDRDFLFFLEIISGSPKMTSPKELPLKTSLELTPQQRLLSSLSWAGACSFDVEEYSGLGLDTPKKEALGNVVFLTSWQFWVHEISAI